MRVTQKGRQPLKKCLLLACAALIFTSEHAIAQNWNEVVKKTASDKAERDEFGYSVSLSGTTAIAGAIGHNYDAGGANSMNNAGAAYVLVRDNNGNWNEAQKLVSSDRVSQDWFGWSVSISGSFAVIGAYQEDEDATGSNTLSSAGSAYIFERDNNGVWTQVQKITSSDRHLGEYFGYSVSISDSTIIVGAAQKDDGSAWGCGAAYIFERNSSGVWNEVAKVMASDRSAGDWFGERVSISGNKAIVGADANNGGAAYVFERNINGVWNQTQKLVSSDINAGDHFGGSVCISGDITVIGAYGENEDASGMNYSDRAGSAYIFERSSGGQWNQVQKITASDRDSMAFFGHEVAISGSTIVVSADLEKKDANGGNGLYRCGAVYVFEKNTSGAWNQVQKIAASDRAAQDRYGFGGVAASNQTIIVGSPEKNYSGTNTLEYAGAVYFYEKGTASIKNSNANDVRLIVAPNPSNGHFRVNATSQMNKPVTITVTNLLGRVITTVETETNRETDVDVNIPAGMYYLTASGTDRITTEKIIIQ